MTDALGWLSRREGDVPPGEGWLGEKERRVLAGFRLGQRRVAWRLGRWTAKAALAAWLEVAASRIEVIAAPDGAPEAWLDGLRIPVSVSLSHRCNVALAVVADAPLLAGCDLELIEPRSEAFVREWLAPSEQQLVFSCSEPQRSLVANLIWTGKEAAAKVRRAGLRLNVRQGVVTAADPYTPSATWRALHVRWDDGQGTTSGWWRAENGWVMALAAEPAPGVPRPLGMTPSGCGCADR